MTQSPEGFPTSDDPFAPKDSLGPESTSSSLARIWSLPRIARISLGSLILLAMVLPWVVHEAIQAKVGTASFHEWLPENRPERFRYDRFVEQFGTDQYVLISWEGCVPEDPRLEQFRNRLQASLDQKEDWIESVHSGGDAMARLQEAPLNLSREQAASRLQGFLIGPKGTTALIVRLTDRGVTEHTGSMERLREAADEVAGLGRGRLKMAGTVYEAYAVDEAAADNLRRLVLPSSLTALAVAIFFLRSWKYSFVALGLAGLGQLFLVMLVSVTGSRFSAVLIVLPTLVFMLTLSGAIHLLNYHRQIPASHGIWRGPLALRHGFLPTLYSALTTVLGMGSLATSQLAPVRLFGAWTFHRHHPAAGDFSSGLSLVSGSLSRQHPSPRRAFGRSLVQQSTCRPDPSDPLPMAGLAQSKGWLHRRRQPTPFTCLLRLIAVAETSHQVRTDVSR
jgi:predicted RND superfamily exporter protein